MFCFLYILRWIVKLEGRKWYFATRKHLLFFSGFAVVACIGMIRRYHAVFPLLWQLDNEHQRARTYAKLANCQVRHELSSRTSVRAWRCQNFQMSDVGIYLVEHKTTVVVSSSCTGILPPALSCIMTLSVHEVERLNTLPSSISFNARRANLQQILEGGRYDMVTC